MKKRAYIEFAILIFIATTFFMFLKNGGFHADKPSSYITDIDIIYAIFTSIIIILIGTRVEREQPFSAIALSLCILLSALFYSLYIFTSPFEAFIVVLSFLYPSYIWKRQQIGDKLFIGLLFIATAACLLLGKSIVSVFIMPLSYLISFKLARGVQIRYSQDTPKGSCSVTSNAQRVNTVSGKDRSWLSTIKPEIEEILEKLNKLSTGNLGERKNVESRMEVDFDYLRIQHPLLMSQELLGIKKQDPCFSQENFLDRINKTFIKIQRTWYSQNIDKIQHMISDALYEQLKMKIAEQIDDRIKFKSKNLKIYDTRIVQINSDYNFNVIHVFISASSSDSLIDIKTDALLEKNERNRKFREYWSFVRKPSTKTIEKPGLLEDHCPNCGADIKIGQATVCNICRSFIRSGSYDWVLAKITQACEWEYEEPKLIPLWELLTHEDKDFSALQIEDRTAVIFWTLRLAERRRSSSPIKRFASNKFCNELGAICRKLGPKGKAYHENISLASVTLKGISLYPDDDKLYALIVWSGIPYYTDSSGYLENTGRKTSSYRDIFVLSRVHGKRTRQNNALVSAHCPCCGGALSSSLTTVCEYCNSVINDGSEWVLYEIISENTEEYQSIMREKAKVKAEIELREEEEEKRNPIIRSARDIITILIQVLMADGIIDEQEKELLDQAAKNHSISHEQIDSIIEAVKNGLVYVPRPSHGMEAKNLVFEAAKMAMVDGVLSPEEEDIIYSLGKHLGYSKIDIVSLLKSATTSLLLVKRDAKKLDLAQEKNCKIVPNNNAVAIKED